MTAVVTGRPSILGHSLAMVLIALVASAGLVIGATVAKGLYGDGLAFGGDLTGRLALLFFVAFLVVEPLSRLAPWPRIQAWGQERTALTLGFAAAMAVSLVCRSAPLALMASSSIVSDLLYCLFTAAILVVLVRGSLGGRDQGPDASIARAMQRIAVGYFWLVFAAVGVVHFNGPHRPDSWFGASLALLIGALLICIGETWYAKRARLAG